MKVKINNQNLGGGPTITARCPHCGHMGTFEKIQNLHDLLVPPDQWLGLRRCPNDQCWGQLFFISKGVKMEISFPPQQIDFDPQNIPEKIIKIFKEALDCHANNCYLAAGMMIRRTLEEMCHDKKATGENLKNRIKMLKNIIVLPNELFDGMDELRLLGNDAAHVESKDFENIGKEELEISIDFTKEILKAVYQYSSLLNRIKELKKK